LRFALFKTFSSKTISGLCVSTTTTVVLEVIISQASSDVTFIVLNDSDIDPTLRRVMDEIDKKPELKERFVTSDEAWDMMTSKTLRTINASKLFIDAKRETPIAAPIASKSGRLCPMTITLSPSVRISGLDLALGRGGDQVAIKNMNGNVRFYGGKTDPMEKRTRVRARVISHALKDILTEGDHNTT
jgi:c-di-AMP phosphodiesterase-like protein